MVLQGFNLNDLLTFPATGEHRTVFPVVDVNGVLVEVFVHFVAEVALNERVVTVFLLLLLLFLLLVLTLLFIGLLRKLLFLALILIIFRFMLLQLTLSLVNSFFSDAFSVCLDSVGINICLHRHASLTIVVVKLLSALPSVDF